MVARTYYPDPEPVFAKKPAVSSDDPCHIRHGYTIADLDRLTARALAADRLLAMPIAERRDIAWSAIAEAILAAQDAPSPEELVQVGWQAIYRHIRDGLRQRGYADGARDWSNDTPTSPKFIKFWRGDPAGFEERIVEKTALHQVLNVVSGIYREAVVALAVHGTQGDAAAALGITYAAYKARLTTARKQLSAAWHEGETPRQAWVDRRVQTYRVGLSPHCSAGHEYTPENTRMAYPTVRGRVVQVRRCRACQRDRDAARPASRAAARQSTHGSDQ